MPEQVKPPVPLEMVLRAVIGKAAERGLRAEQVEENMVRVFYDVPREKKDVTNDSQAFRSIVERAGQDQWRPRLQSLGESGYLVEVLPPRGRLVVPQVAPGPVAAGQEIDLEDTGEIKKLAEQLMGVAQKLTELAGGLLVVVSLM